MNEYKNKSLNELIESEQKVLIDFSAEWCGPCKMMEPILKDVKKEIGDSALIIKIDVDKNPTLASKYSIRSVPTLMLFKQGKLVWNQSGVVQSNDLVKLLNNI